MPAIKIDIRVDMEDGESYVVVADQRDVSKYERSGFCNSDNRHTTIRHFAWSASKRQGKTSLTWEKFDDQCVMAQDVKPEAEPLDPGQPEPRIENSSRSSGVPAAE